MGMNIVAEIPDDLAHFVEREVRSGRFKSTEEAVVQALALLEAASGADAPFAGEVLDDLRRAWREGEASPDADAVDFEAIKRMGRDVLGGRS